jgi:hypothetical protein
MMHSRMTRPTERLEIIQGIVASAPVTAASRPAKVQMVHGEVVAGSAPLTLEAVAFQRLLSIAAEMEVVERLTLVCFEPVFWHLRHRAAYVRHLLSRGTLRAAYLRSAAINKINSAVGALAGRAEDLNVGGSPVSGQTFPVVPRANNGDARVTDFLTCSSWFVRSAALRANAVTQPVAGFPVRVQGAWAASFCVGGFLYHLFAAAKTGGGSVRSCWHGPSYHGGWQIV